MFVCMGASASSTRSRRVRRRPHAGVQIHAAVADDFLSNRSCARIARRAHRARRPTGARRRFSSLHCAGVVGRLQRSLPSPRRSLRRDTTVRRGRWINITQQRSLRRRIVRRRGYQYFFEGAKSAEKRLFGQYVSRDVYSSSSRIRISLDSAASGAR